MSKPRVADAAEGQPVEPEHEGERREEPQRQPAAEGEQKSPAETSRAEAAQDKVQEGVLKRPAEPLMGAQAVNMTEASTLALADQQIKTEGDSARSEEQEQRQDSGPQGSTAHQSNTMEAEARKYWKDRDADAGWTAGKGKRYQAGLSRLGLNRPENIKALAEQWDSVDHDLAPMMVVPYEEFKKLGKLPRSSDRKTVPLSEVGQGGHIAFCSHNWMRGSKKQCERNGHKWEGSAHPDDEKGTKHRLLCASVEQLAKDKKWELGEVYIWLDFCGIEQDILERKMAGVESLRGYVAVCDAIIVPYPDAPPADASTVDRLQTYGERGWTRLEAMVAYIMGILRGLEAPDIFVAWREGEGSVKVKQFDYSLDPDHLPASCGKEHLTDERDRPALEEHQNKLLEEMKASVKRNGYVTKHGDRVWSVAFHPTRQGVLASAGQDGVVKLVKQETGTTLLQMEGAGTTMRSIAFNKDGSLLAGGGEDGNIYLWDPESGNKQGTLMGHSDYVTWVAFSPDSKTLASASRDNTVKLWDLSGDAPVEKGTLRGHSGSVTSVAFSPDSKTLASASGDQTIKLWDLSGDVPVQKGTLRGHSSDNPECTCSHGVDGDEDEDEEEEDYLGQDGEEYYKANPECPVTGHSDWVVSVAFSPDSKTLASASRDNTVKLWDLTGETPVEKGTLRGHSEGNPECTCTDIDRVYDRVTAECPVRGHLRAVTSVAWNHDGSLLASAGSSFDNTVRLWDPTTMEDKGTLTGHSDGVLSVAWNHDGSLLASGSSDKTVRLWTPYGQENGTLKGHSDWVGCVTFSPNGSLLASATEDSTVKLLDPTTMEEKGTLTGHSNVVLSVAFSPDDKTLASGSSDETVKLWDLSGDAPVEKGTLTGHSTWDPECKCRTGVKCPLKGHSDEVTCVAWNHDGFLLASASKDETVKLWDPTTMEEKGTLRGHSDSVTSVAFSPDSKTLASASGDGTVKLWDLSGDAPVEKVTVRGHSRDNPECTCRHYHNEYGTWLIDVNAECTVTGHSGEVNCVAFSPDGALFASASNDRTVKLWDPTTMEEKGTLKGIVASWQIMDPETEALAAKVKAGGSSGSNRTGQYIVTANSRSDMVYVYKTNADGKKQGEPLACFRSPDYVWSVSCWGTKVVLGCHYVQVLFLEAPLLAVG